MFYNRAASLRVLIVVFTLTVIACSNSDDDSNEASTNLPQSEDMATIGESEDDNSADIADEENSSKIVFEDYNDKYLSQLKLVARDGTIKKGPDYEVNYTKLPDFKKINHIPDRKKSFFNYLMPAIEYQNQLIRERRQILKGIALKMKLNMTLSSAQENYMVTMRDRYRVPPENDRNQAVELLLRRVDTLPVSMVLAQAAMESAWGTSRFAREANNLFGQWCYSKGCGLVPKQRSSSEAHEVQKFRSVDRAIGAYFLNINSHPAYQKIREIRETLRAKGVDLSGHEMVAGLERYSAKGQAYIDELRSLIRTNKLES